MPDALWKALARGIRGDESRYEDFTSTTTSMIAETSKGRKACVRNTNWMWRIPICDTGVFYLRQLHVGYSRYSRGYKTKIVIFPVSRRGLRQESCLHVRIRFREHPGFKACQVLLVKNIVNYVPLTGLTSRPNRLRHFVQYLYTPSKLCGRFTMLALLWSIWWQNTGCGFYTEAEYRGSGGNACDMKAYSRGMGHHIGRESKHLTGVFCGYPAVLQANVGIVSWSIPGPLPSELFHIHFSIIIIHPPKLNRSNGCSWWVSFNK
jgi:hypothetical protein